MDMYNIYLILNYIFLVEFKISKKNIEIIIDINAIKHGQDPSHPSLIATTFLYFLVTTQFESSNNSTRVLLNKFLLSLSNKSPNKNQIKSRNCQNLTLTYS